MKQYKVLIMINIIVKCRSSRIVTSPLSDTEADANVDDIK